MSFLLIYTRYARFDLAATTDVPSIQNRFNGWKITTSLKY